MRWRELDRANRVRLLLWVLFLAGGAGLGLWLDWRHWRGLLTSPWFHLATFPLGALLLRFVFTAARTTGRHLAREGRVGPLPRLQTNRLVTTGPYACMRHPMHFGLLFFPLAVALLIGSPSFIGLIAPAEMVLMVVLVLTLEEREATRKFGADYARYRQRVPPFSLRPDCLRRLLGRAG